MTSIRIGIGLILMVALSTRAHAQAYTESDFVVSLGSGGVGVPLSGQTVDIAAYTVMANSSITGSLRDVECAIAASGCTSGPGTASLGAGPSTPPGLAGLTSSFSEFAGANSANASLSVLSGGATLPAGQITFSATELQQLQINYTGSAPPPNVGVDISYSVNASASGSVGSGITTAQVDVLDPATYSAANNTVEAAFLAAAVAGTSSQLSSALSQTSLLSLIPNKYYVVDVSSGGQFLVTAGTAASGVLSLDASADPTFSVDPAWLAANPQYAGDITITQSYNGSPVPLPAAGWLLVSGLGALGASARRWRRAI